MKAKRKCPIVQFPLTLHQILENKEYCAIISWLPHGGFIIRKRKEFVEKIMPRYFQMSKYFSFQKQLNNYCFKRITSGPNKGGYCHERFLREKPELCENTRRNDWSDKENKKGGINRNEIEPMSKEKTITDVRTKNRIELNARKEAVDKNENKISDVKRKRAIELEAWNGRVQNNQIGISPSKNTTNKRRCGMELQTNKGGVMTSKRSIVSSEHNFLPITYTIQLVEEVNILKVGMYVHIIRGVFRKSAGYIESLDHNGVRLQCGEDSVRVNKCDVMKIT